MMATAYESGVVQAQLGAPASPRERPSARAWYALVVLVVAMVFGYVDRQILILLAQSIKHDLALSDLQIGETHGLGPAVLAGLAMFPLAWLADRFERRTVLCVCVIFWSIATAASGLAWNFATLQACTIGIAIGEAALTPIVYSLIPDLFPPASRARANIITYGATALGVGLGLALGGALLGVVAHLRVLLPVWLAALETWRLTFFIVAIPGPLVAIAVFLIGATRREVTAPQNLAPALRIGTYVREHGLVALGAFGTMACFTFALQAVGNWLPVALIRIFQADAAAVGINFGFTFMAGAAVGLVTAAIITPFWRRVAGTAYVLRAIAVASAGAAVPALLLVFAANTWQVYGLFFLFSAIFITGVALMPGMMQDITPPALRARVIAGGTVLFMVVGYVSPPLVGFISDRLSSSPRGLIWAIVAVTLTGLLLCAALSRFMEGPYRRTVAVIPTA
jgi:MFS family permease